jgi:alpha-D-ribose 1-methylphosphonate 5-triphosphate synthase subunit PhnL
VARLRELKDAGVAMIGVFHHPEDVLPLVDNELMLTADDTLEMAEKELADVAQ